MMSGEDIMVNLYDSSNTSEPLIMYGTKNPDGHMSHSYSTMLDFGDPFRKHEMKCRKDCRKMEELKVQAEAVDAAKSQFLATVSQGIRTPMNGVLEAASETEPWIITPTHDQPSNLQLADHLDHGVSILGRKPL